MTRIVVSLTTIPDRVKLLPETLAALDKQTQRPNVIYLQIPYVTKKGKLYDIEELQKVITAYPNVIINRPLNDAGPITKFVPVLDQELDPNTWIILVDDDMIYDARMIEKLMNPTYDHLPAIGFAGRDNNLSFKYNLSLMTSDIAFLETFGGVRYKRSLFPENSTQFLQFVETCHIKEPKCSSTDDIIIGKWVSNQTTIYVIPFADNKCTTHSQVNNTPQLRNENLGSNGNNAVCFQHLYGKVLTSNCWCGWKIILFLLFLTGIILYISRTLCNK